MLVAVYGSLRKGLSNYSRIQDANYKGQFDTEPIYTMYDLKYYPAIIKGGNTSVVMEVFEVDKNTLKDLDSLEGFDDSRDTTLNYYNRETIKTPYGKAIVYIFNQAEALHGKNIVETGDWKDYHKNKNAYV